MTPEQQAAVDAVAEHGSQRKAADALGISRRALRDRLVHAARKGHAPGHFESGTAPGYLMGKVTVQRGATGEVERTWERQSPEQEAMREAMDAAVRAMSQDITRALPIPAPTAALADLLKKDNFI